MTTISPYFRMFGSEQSTYVSKKLAVCLEIKKFGPRRGKHARLKEGVNFVRIQSTRMKVRIRGGQGVLPADPHSQVRILIPVLVVTEKEMSMKVFQ